MSPRSRFIATWPNAAWKPHSEEWKQAIQDTLARQREAMRPRLFPELPKNRYICFYPMDRRQGRRAGTGTPCPLKSAADR